MQTHKYQTVFDAVESWLDEDEGNRPLRIAKLFHIMKWGMLEVADHYDLCEQFPYVKVSK